MNELKELNEEKSSSIKNHVKKIINKDVIVIDE